MESFKFESAFSSETLGALANESSVLRADVDRLISISHLYAQDIELLQDAIRQEIETQNLVDRQKQHHDEFIKALQELAQHAHEQGKDIPYDIDSISNSRVMSSHLALYIARQHESVNVLYGSLPKSA